MAQCTNRPPSIALVMTSVVLFLAGCGAEHAGRPGTRISTPRPPPPVPVMMLGHTVACRPKSGSGSGGTRLVFSGPCAYTERAALRCAVRKGDDFRAFASHRLPYGWNFYATITAEGYKKPGTFAGKTHVFIEVTRGVQFYAWGESKATGTVEKGARGFILSGTVVRPWPGTLAKKPEYVVGRVVCRV